MYNLSPYFSGDLQHTSHTPYDNRYAVGADQYTIGSDRYAIGADRYAIGSNSDFQSLLTRTMPDNLIETSYRVSLYENDAASQSIYTPSIGPEQPDTASTGAEPAMSADAESGEIVHEPYMEEHTASEESSDTSISSPTDDEDRALHAEQSLSDDIDKNASHEDEKDDAVATKKSASDRVKEAAATNAAHAAQQNDASKNTRASQNDRQVSYKDESPASKGENEVEAAASQKRNGKSHTPSKKSASPAATEKFGAAASQASNAANTAGKKGNISNRETEPSEKEDRKIAGAKQKGARTPQNVSRRIEVVDMRPLEESAALQKHTARESFGEPHNLSDTLPRLDQNRLDQTQSGVAQKLTHHLREYTHSDILRHAQFVIRGERNGAIHLSLKPESMGTIKVHLQLQDNSITGRITVENGIVRDIFEQNMGDLEEAFREHGIDLAQLDVSVDMHQAQQEMDHSILQSHLQILENTMPQLVEVLQEEVSIDLLA